MAIAVVVLVSLVAARGAHGFTFHMPKLGGCPELAAYPQFVSNMGEFLGSWFVRSSLDTEVLQGKGKCMTANYKYIPNKSYVVVSTKQIGLESKKWESVEAFATPSNSSSDEGRFDVKFNIPVWGEVGGKYTVLGTDFENYAVVHGCGSFWGILHYDCSWLLSRKQETSPEEEREFYLKTNEVLSAYSNAIDGSKFEKVDQSGCIEG